MIQVCDTQERDPIVFEFGCAPDAVALGYGRVFEVIYGTEAQVKKDWRGQDVILVKGACMNYDPKVMEFAVMVSEAPPLFQAGDVVTYTNPQGVVFPGVTIVGTEFWKGHKERRYFYSQSDTPWFSVPESCLKR